MATQREIEAQLTGPGGGFEVTTQLVHGVATRVYTHRMSSLGELFATAGARSDESIFITSGDCSIGYASFVESCLRAASRLRSGPGAATAGDRVAVAAANCPEWCRTFWATVSSGLVLVGLNGWWKGDELLYGLADSGARVLVADRARYERVAGRLGSCPELRVVYVIDSRSEDLPAPGGSVVVESASALFGPFGNSSEPALDERPGEAAIDEDDPAVIFYTSGTTGRPKGAVSTHRGMLANLQNTFYLGVVGALAVTTDGGGGSMLPTGAGGQAASLLTSPLFHVSGCHSNLVVAFAAGLRLVIPAGRFDPVTVMETIERERIGIWAAVPSMAWRVVDEPRRHDFDLSSVVSIAYGGSPSAGELRRRVQETFVNVKSVGNAYGLTERGCPELRGTSVAAR